MNATLLVDLEDVATCWKERNLVREDQIPYYVRWLQRFLVGPGADARLSPQDAQRVFVEQLERTGHKSVETTMIYTHVMRGLNSTAVSPLDALEASSGPVGR